LWSTEYGRALLMKLGGVAAVGVCGWVNWRGVRRGAPPNRIVMTVEWVAAVAVLALTAQLTETEHP
jgi:putative copper export protein